MGLLDPHIGRTYNKWSERLAGEVLGLAAVTKKRVTMTLSVTPDSIQELQSEALKELNLLEAPDALENWRLSFLGRGGRLTGLLRAVGSLPQDQRRSAGALANQTKGVLEERMAIRPES